MSAFCVNGQLIFRYPSAHNAGAEVEESGFHVLLEGAQVGPYDRRTILGMRIKQLY